jgi:hypothetical protein
VREQLSLYGKLITPPSQYTVIGVNDLGMHCGDLDTRLASILPPYNVLHAVVLKKGLEPHIVRPGDGVFENISVSYSAASSPYDIVFDPDNPQPPGFDEVGGGGAFTGVYKTNWWDEALNRGAYNPFYPIDFGSLLPIPDDTGLVVPDPVDLPGLTVAQQAMPGILGPYLRNDRQEFERFDTSLPFFTSFPFGYNTGNVRWFGADGIPLTTFDDAGRVNPYPLMRISVVDNTTRKAIATIDTVAPVSGEANCRLCHTNNDPANGDVGGYTDTAQGVRDTNPLYPDNTGNMATALDDPEYGSLPLAVSVEYAQDLNILRYHDRGNGDEYTDDQGNSTPCEIGRFKYFSSGSGVPSDDPPVLDPNWPDGNENCLSYKAHVLNEPVVCQTCHYTPALDLTQVGPIGGSPDYADDGVGACPPNADPSNCVANGRTQRNKPSMSHVIHSAHSSFSNQFPMPPPTDPDRDVVLTADNVNAACLKGSTSSRRIAQCNACVEAGLTVAQCSVENTCYNCHPGKYTKCLRGAMGAADMFCQDCHGNLAQVGDDFSGDLSLSNPFPDGADLSKRVPWANEPGCQSCHVGDAINQPADTTGFIYADDGIRLLQAWPTGDPDATPIAAPNSRFAEDQSGDNRILFRLSRGSRSITLDTSGETMRTGHRGVFCEACHGPTHAEWPVTPDAPDTANGPTWPPATGSFVANDNVTSGQLQGHTGKIIECATCHTGDYTHENALGGPHGMHPVGGSVGGPLPAAVSPAGYSQWWVSNHGEFLTEEDTYEPTCDDLRNQCGTCHGDYGQGTPLSEMSVTRTVTYFGGRLKTLPADSELACTNCHSRNGGPFVAACGAPPAAPTVVANP